MSKAANLRQSTAEASDSEDVSSREQKRLTGADTLLQAWGRLLSNRQQEAAVAEREEAGAVKKVAANV